MSGRPPLASLTRVLAGATDDLTTSEWLRAGFSRWIDSAGSISLERALDLPPASRTPAALRDFWLSAALDECGGRVSRLDRACTSFDRRAWPHWRDLPSAPSSASRIERALFLARRAAPFPGRRRLAQILSVGSNRSPSLPLG